jgi:phage tail-like protein
MNAKEILLLLPDIFQRTYDESSPLSDMLQVMELMHVPAEKALANLPDKFDPQIAPTEFLPFLAYCLQLDWLLEYFEDKEDLRILLANAANLIRWRGTVQGLDFFLETATQNPGRFEVKENETLDGQIRPFHLLIEAPESQYHRRQLIEKIIQWEKPAYMTYELRFTT